MQKATDFRASWIPFDGGRDAALAVLGGHLDVAFMTRAARSARWRMATFASWASRSTNARPTTRTSDVEGAGVRYQRGALARRDDEDRREPPRRGPAAEGDRRRASLREWKKYRADNRQEARDIREGDMARVVERELEASRDFLKTAGFLK